MKKSLLFYKKTFEGSMPFGLRMTFVLVLSLLVGNLTMANGNDALSAASSELQDPSVNGGTLSEDDYSFCVGDGQADHVMNVSAENAVGPNMQWVVTSPGLIILVLLKRLHQEKILRTLQQELRPLHQE